MHRILLRVQAWHRVRERTSGEWAGTAPEGWAGTTGSRPEMTTQLLADSEAEPPVTTVSVARRLRHWLSVARDLMTWYEQTPYKQPSDYLWATDANRAGSKRGKQPVWLSTVMRDHIQPLARRLSINKRIGWHTFRHTFSTLLKSNGED